MTSVERIEIGLVSRDDALATFLSDVLEVPREAPEDHGPVVLHRLGTPGATVKVVVPRQSPTPRDADPFMGRVGLRYLTLRVDDVDRIVERWTAAGGSVETPVFEFAPGSCVAVVKDPDGNTYEIVGSA